MKSIEIIMIPVKDRQKAKEFYVKLGMNVIVEAKDPHGDPWIQLGFPGKDTTISLSSFNAVIYETEDIEKEIALLKTKGIEVGKVDPTPNGKFAWVNDLDGNGICLRERPKA